MFATGKDKQSQGMMLTSFESRSLFETSSRNADTESKEMKVRGQNTHRCAQTQHGKSENSA